MRIAQRKPLIEESDMAGPEFFQTQMGRAFYEGTMPRLVKTLEKIAFELQRANDLAEKRLAREKPSQSEEG
jgi:hypothetical protein